MTDRPVRPRVAVLFIGGMHQALHIAPVAVALEQSGAAEVIAYVPNAGDSAALKVLIARMGAPALTTVQMRLPVLLEGPLAWRGYKTIAKAIRLLVWHRKIRAHDAILAAERTSTLLKQLPGRTPPMIHIPHGAGDRAKGFEPRLALFDHIIVAGAKDRRRMIAQGLVTPEHCTVSGAVKPAAIRRMQKIAPERLFDNDRPVILYNPHFRDALASWQHFAVPLIEAILADGRFNLIVAPHVRRFETASEAQREVWRRRAVAGRVVIDLDSPKLNDMSYTSAADIYLGDVSSQVYEFLIKPRPCIFIDAHGVDWQDNPDYAMWALGPVCQSLPDIIDQIANAAALHDHYAGVQQAAVVDALGDTGDRAPEVAAQQLLDALS